MAQSAATPVAAAARTRRGERIDTAFPKQTAGVEALGAAGGEAVPRQRPERRGERYGARAAGGGWGGGDPARAGERAPRPAGGRLRPPEVPHHALHEVVLADAELRPEAVAGVDVAIDEAQELAEGLEDALAADGDGGEGRDVAPGLLDLLERLHVREVALVELYDLREAVEVEAVRAQVGLHVAPRVGVGAGARALRVRDEGDGIGAREHDLASALV